jgi:SAM-dependent methyltransferase
VSGGRGHAESGAIAQPSPSVTSALPPSPDDRATWRSTWFTYYSEKRIQHQWLQVHLLQSLTVERVLEVGPYLGLVTALLDNAGYRVTTLDLTPRHFDRPVVPHIQADLTTVDPDRLAGFDAILCCETLEHLPWEAVPRILATFRQSGARYLITSVPFEGLQIDVWLAANLHRVRQRLSFKKGRSLMRFSPDADPFGHKWEVGYRGRSLVEWERVLAASGWRAIRREFTFTCRSVFHVLEAAPDR